MNRFKDTYKDPRPCMLVLLLNAYNEKNLDRIQEIIFHQDARWTKFHPHDQNSLQLLLKSYPTAKKCQPCSYCGCKKEPIIYAFDATGMSDDPDDFYGEYPDDHEPKKEWAVELTCSTCGITPTGTCIEETYPKALAISKHAWNATFKEMHSLQHTKNSLMPSLRKSDHPDQ